MAKAEVKSALTFLLSWICAFDAARSQDQTWITVNKGQVSSYTASFRDTSLDILCNTEISDSTANITSQYLFKSQNFTYDSLDGSVPPDTSWSGWSKVCYPSTQWKISGMTCLNATQTTSQQMSSGIRINDISPFASGLYMCSTNYVSGNNVQVQMNSTVVSINTNGPVAASLSVSGLNSDGDQSILSSASDSIDVSQYTSASVVCYISSSNEVPQYQMFVNLDEVTGTANTSGSYGSIAYLTGLNDSGAFSSITYQISASYEFSVAGPCSNWTVSCTSWVKSSPDQPTTTMALLSSPFCTLQVAGNRLTNRASPPSTSMLPITTISWTLLCAFSINL